jgi:hypothetical protein
MPLPGARRHRAREGLHPSEDVVGRPGRTRTSRGLAAQTRAIRSLRHRARQ